MAEGCEHTALSEQWLHAHSILTSLLGLLPFSLGKILCISVCCVLLCRKTAARKKSSLCSYRKESPLILICQLQFRIIKACISGRDSVAWQNLLAPCWDQLNRGRLSSMALALGKQKPGHCHGEQKPCSEGGKIYDLKWFLKMKHRIPGSLFLLSLETRQKTGLGKDKGAAQAPSTELH